MCIVCLKYPRRSSFGLDVKQGTIYYHFELLEKVLESGHLDIAVTLENYAVLLAAMGRENEAVAMKERAKGI